jgi:phospholipase C
VKLQRAASAMRTSLTALTVGFILSSSSLTPLTQLHAATIYPTATPIKNLVVIFQENQSFDHYFGTYPNALNLPGESPFTARTGTPSVNGLSNTFASPNNSSQNNGATATVQPQRISPIATLASLYPGNSTNGLPTTTCDEGHGYTQEQQAVHGLQILTDAYVTYTGSSSSNCLTNATTVMNYFDGNAVTAMWNYAQHFAMNDNSYSTMYGPSAPGAVNLVAGNTHGVVGSTQTGVTAHTINQTTGAAETSTISIAGTDFNGDTAGGTLMGDARPLNDDCAPSGSAQTSFGTPGATSNPTNIGNLLSNAGITWGWFQGGFRPAVQYDGVNTQFVDCGTLHTAADGTVKQDYIAHHEPFQFFTPSLGGSSTQNLHHLAPSSPAKIGQTDQANHQYDVSDLFTVSDINPLSYQSQSPPISETYPYHITGLQPGVTLPAVTFIKAPGFMDGHPQYSNPLLEQAFLVDVINALMKSTYWPNMAILILYDDSDGWYDHVTPPLVNPSSVSTVTASATNFGSWDSVTGVFNAAATTSGAHGSVGPSGFCGTPPTTGTVVQGRCGYGPRQPFVVISPFTKINFVDHTVTDQSSVIKFIEDNWLGGQRINVTPTPVIQGGSFDQIAGSLLNMFNFTTRHSLAAPGLQLDRVTGQVIAGGNDE